MGGICKDTNHEKNKVNTVVTRLVRGSDRLGDKVGEVTMKLVKRVYSGYEKEIVLFFLDLTLPTIPSQCWG